MKNLKLYENFVNDMLNEELYNNDCVFKLKGFNYFTIRYDKQNKELSFNMSINNYDNTYYYILIFLIEHKNDYIKFLKSKSSIFEKMEIEYIRYNYSYNYSHVKKDKLTIEDALQKFNISFTRIPCNYANCNLLKLLNNIILEDKTDYNIPKLPEKIVNYIESLKSNELGIEIYTNYEYMNKNKIIIQKMHDEYTSEFNTPYFEIVYTTEISQIYNYLNNDYGDNLTEFIKLINYINKTKETLENFGCVCFFAPLNNGQVRLIGY